MKLSETVSKVLWTDIKTNAPREFVVVIVGKCFVKDISNCINTLKHGNDIWDCNESSPHRAEHVSIIPLLTWCEVG